MPVPQRNRESEMGALQMELTQAVLDKAAKDGYISVLRDYIQRLEKYIHEKFGPDALDDFSKEEQQPTLPQNRAARRATKRTTPKPTTFTPKAGRK